MNSALGPRIVSLLDMLEINARPFLAVVAQLRDIQMLIATKATDRTIRVSDDDLDILQTHADLLIEAVTLIGARSALKSAERLKVSLESGDKLPNYDQLAVTLADIESRFADHLEDIMMFVVPDQHAVLFGDAAALMGDDDIVLYFPSATFELEEAAKCLGLSRPTACVFHCMRMLEIGIKALARHLGIEDPVNATERNWGVFLGKIKEALDAKHPKKKRLPGTEGAELEGIYTTLDAIKGPWRNATMHVEAVYTDADAQHILQCCVVFMKKLMERCDENGEPLG